LGVVVTVMSSDTLGAGAGALAAPPDGAGLLPHAVAAAAQITAIRR
jgi:hypothetical protein